MRLNKRWKVKLYRWTHSNKLHTLGLWLHSHGMPKLGQRVLNYWYGPI